jgi:hypothetical protein
MRPSNILKGFFAFILVSGALSLMAQQPGINYFRPWDQNGVNQFETTKDEVAPYDGIKVRVGGAFTQQYQGLTHESNADFVRATNDTTKNLNELYPLGGGFNLATANLNLDVQLGDGIRLALENYMSSRHHSEFWVKGGYIQFDKLPFFGSPEFFSKYITIKVGHMEINYGDQHFRRTDNGNSFFNPFVGNTIMDAFATEIGGEAYFKHPSGVFAMVGLTAGLINGDVRDYGEADPDNGVYTKGPSTYFKAGIDRKFGDDFRFRLTGSLYMNNNTVRNTLYAGDRTGSRYYLAMEKLNQSDAKGNITTPTSASAQFTSGRINPGFTNQITAIMVNTLIQFKGLELFGTYETASGRAGTGEERSFGQFSAELAYRFLKNDQLFVAGRYNSASGDLSSTLPEVSINRYAVGLGWYVTKNLLAKLEYVNQDYVDFPSSDYRFEGNFNGFMIEAAVGF